MLSRDTRVHLSVVGLAVAGLAVGSQLTPDPLGPLAIIGVLLYNGLVLAGAHLYLAWRGEDGLVPVASRWRFIGAVAIVLVLGGISLLTDPVSVGPVSSDGLLAGFAVLVAVSYLLLEASAGYRASTDSAGS